MASARNGFSLIELSIVLVILGLLTGGILGGKNLIEAAEQRSIITDNERYRTAIYTFRGKYLALPGDMPNATQFWGELDADPATCSVTESDGLPTCDGDGNNQISDVFVVGTYYEWFRFWHHLSNAGLVEGNYTGAAGSGGLADANIGENVPASKIGGAGWTPRYLGNYAGDSVWFNASYGNFLVFGAEAPNWSTNDAVLSPSQAYTIDMKIDDGKPGKGKVIAVLWDDCTDAADEDDLDADYALSVTSVECALAILKAF